MSSPGSNAVWCWEDGAERGHPETTCTLPEGHASEHQWTPDANITVQFADASAVEWKAYEAKCLAEGICPDSGLRLHANGNAAAVSDLSCDVCDCFGYKRKEVGSGVVGNQP